MPNPSDRKEPASGFSTNIIRLTADVAVFEPHGEIDCHNQAAFSLSLEAVGEQDLVIDFRGLRYMGADSLPAILKAYQRRVAIGGHVALVVGPSQGTIQKVLKIWLQRYKLSGTISVFSNTDDALAALLVNS